VAQRNTPKKPRKKGPGYHLRHIRKGKLGELSKVEEELLELKDALAQGVRIMALVELADMYGALKAYVQTQFGMTIDDLARMSAVTERAFRNGHR
jgi:hypothetical protein